MKQIQADTHFHLPLMLMLKNPVFSCGIQIPYQQLLVFFCFIIEL